VDGVISVLGVIVVAWFISLFLVVAGFFIMDSGYHVSAAWEGYQTRTIELDDSVVAYDGQKYDYKDIKVTIKPYEAYIVFGGSKVVYVSKYNCSGYSQLLLALGHKPETY